jgi:tetratricopeptide (TPR) repeat protein
MGLVNVAIINLQGVEFSKLPPQESFAAVNLLVDSYIASGEVEEAYQILSDLETIDARLAGPEMSANFTQARFLASYLMGQLEAAAKAQTSLVIGQVQANQGLLPKEFMFKTPEIAQIVDLLGFQPEKNFTVLLRAGLLNAYKQQLSLLRFEGESLAQIALLYLEAGNNVEAKDYFQRALDLRGQKINFNNRQLAETYLNAMNKAK